MSLPGRWIRTRKGSYGRIVRRSRTGKYYIRWLRSGYLLPGGPCSTEWTKEELLAAKLKFLKRRPTGAPKAGSGK